MISKSRVFLTLSRPQITYSFSLINKLRSEVFKGSIYRAIGILAGIQISATFISHYFVDKQVIFPVEDYLKNDKIKENQHYSIAGIIKPGTIEIKRGTLDVKFILTNFDDDITVIYRGETKYEFKEGETIVLTAYTPDLKNKKRIIGLDYQTKHSMDGYMWEDKVGVNRNNYGLNSKLQSQL
ncbi:unnamed protein product [Paramecium primaurelia]|uniref:Cytochrome c-type biogenesis protein CcmE n=2 Tax=Paramecium TaxID=5884 RepID=A0A8S1TAG1_9CILI|nr:unnamed protein product [Paramecium primaurelia]CAD8147572.1 unnamed protein product [Paramecium pentaurelia]